MVVTITYYALLLLLLGYVLPKGGAPERAIVLAILTASALMWLTRPLRGRHPYAHFEWTAFLIDLVLLAVLLAVALRANRVWPLRVAGLQVATCLGHFAVWIAPLISRTTYNWMTGFWTWPMLAIIAFGTYRHQRRSRAYGVDRSWKRSFAL